MATSGSCATSYYKNLCMMFSWSAKQSTADNTSTISWKLEGYRTDGAIGYITCGGFKIVIDGKTVYSKPTTYRVNVYNGDVVASGEVTLKHDSEGKKSFSVELEAAIYYSAVNCNGSGQFTLNAIPRASELTSASAVVLGNKCSVKWTPKATSFYYKLVFKLGGQTKTITGIAPNTTSAYTYTGFTIPLSWASEITSATTGTVTVALTTHTASSCTSENQVGSADSKTFTVTVPETSDTQPSINMTLSPDSSLSSTFTGLYIQGKTKVKAELSATGKYDATIKSYSMKVDGTTYGSGDNFTSDYLANAGEITVYGYAKDSRGFTGSTSKKITVIGYSKPQILDAVASRCDENGQPDDSGTYLKIKAKRSYSPINSGGEQKNFCKIRYRYKPESADAYSDWVTILARDSLDSDQVETGALLGGVLSLDNTYVVQVGVVDDIGSSTSTTVPISTERVYMHRDKVRRSLSIGMLIQDDHCVDIAEDITVRIRGPLEVFTANTADDMTGNTVDYLKLGAKITATSAAPVSLNKYKTPGNYYSPNADNSRYISDSPYTDGGFALTVRELQNSTYIRQELFYARTTWIRHWDGTEWSGWWRYQTTSVPETASADYVVETGTSGGWTYKKWKGGTYEMFGTFTVTPSESTQNTSLYRTNNMTIAVPFKISSAYVTGTVVGYYWITNGGISGTDKITLRLMSDKTFSTTAAIEVRLHVVGVYT